MTGEKYFIRVLMRVQSTFTEIAQFSLGANEINAIDLFHELEGDFIDVTHYPLRIDLIMENTTRCTPVASLGCTLNQLLSSSKTIIKESFRVMNLSA